MKSIRGRISAWLLPGLVVVWVTGGVVVYRTSQNSILASIDSENMALTRMIRMSQRPGGQGGGRGPRRGGGAFNPSTLPGFSQEGVLYQIWNLDGEILAKSEGLGESNLPKPESSEEVIDRRSLELSSKLRIRTVGMTFGTGDHEGGGAPSHAGGGRPMMIVVARDLAETENRLEGLLLGIIGTGLAMAGGMVLLIRMALRNGLGPLDLLAEEVSNVDPSSLHARFSKGDEPRELKPIVSHLDRLMDRVESGFLRERRFGADLAHEMRTPIAEMRTKLDLAMNWPEERNEEFFMGAREINERMQRVVETMLQLAKIEGGGDGFQTETLELEPLIRGTWGPLEAEAAKKKLRTNIQCPGDASVVGNPDLWKHILTNLFANAVEYTPREGGIDLDCVDGGILISNTVESLDEEEVAHLFERFWRADRSRCDRLHSGLGLSLVQACARDMGYRVSASLREDGCLTIAIRPGKEKGLSPSQGLVMPEERRR